MAAPASANATSPVAVVLIDPTSGLPYKLGQAGVTSTVLKIANATSPLGIVQLNINTGVPQK